MQPLLFALWSQSHWLMLIQPLAHVTTFNSLTAAICIGINSDFCYAIKQPMKILQLFDDILPFDTFSVAGTCYRIFKTFQVP